MTITPEDLERWHLADVAKRRAFLRKHYAWLNEAIREAEAAGDEGLRVLEQLKTLRGYAVRDAELLDRDETIRALRPKARVGEKFTAGRKAGTVSPLRLAVRRILKRRPKATAAEVWASLKGKPPKGITLHDARWGEPKYIKTAGKPNTSFARFRNIVSEERRK